jgi:hypothetical protein
MSLMSRFSTLRKVNVAAKYLTPTKSQHASLPAEIAQKKWDSIVIGAGHNGLIAANYLADAGQKVLVLERRHVVGGAAVTEEIVPGFKFSRASYLAGLLRPQIIKDFELEKFGYVDFNSLIRNPPTGWRHHSQDVATLIAHRCWHPSVQLETRPNRPTLTYSTVFSHTLPVCLFSCCSFEYLVRDPSSFTPTLLDSPSRGKSLLLGSDDAATAASIAQFSARDAETYPRYEEFLSQARELIQPLLDAPLVSPFSPNSADRAIALRTAAKLGGLAFRNRGVLVPFYELLTAPAAQVLDRYVPPSEHISRTSRAVFFCPPSPHRRCPPPRVSCPAQLVRERRTQSDAGDGRRNWRRHLAQARWLCVRFASPRHGRGRRTQGRLGVRPRRHGRRHAGPCRARAHQGCHHR